MNLSKIRALVNQGLTVNWKNGVYSVQEDSGSSSGLSIVYRLGSRQENRVGLMTEDGRVLNEVHWAFYVPAESLDFAVEISGVTQDRVDAEGWQSVRYVVYPATPEQPQLAIAVGSFHAQEIKDDQAVAVAAKYLHVRLITPPTSTPLVI